MRSRCCICRQHLSTMKTLGRHYLTKHNKSKIIKHLLKLTVLLSTPNTFSTKQKLRHAKIPKARSRKIKIYPQSKTETLYLNENIQILCGRNEIIIGDGKSSVDMEFSFDERSNGSQDNLAKKKRMQKTSRKRRRDNSDYCSRSPSASSESSVSSLVIRQRRIKRRKRDLDKVRHFRIDITKLQNEQSLNEQTGEFYRCHCRDNEQPKTFQLTDLRIITSDTESCSDTGKTYFMPIVDKKVFCTKCGSGYKSQLELTQHMYVHETFCRLCNLYFRSEYAFKKHMRMHIFKFFICHVCGMEFTIREKLCLHFQCHFEDKTFDTVLDMEEEYQYFRYNFVSAHYNNSINSILYFLKDGVGVNYNRSFRKIICDICYLEVFVCDYENHLRNVHYTHY